MCVCVWNPPLLPGHSCIIVEPPVLPNITVVALVQ